MVLKPTSSWTKAVSMLLDSLTTTDLIERRVQTTDRLWCYSAFSTTTAVRWIRSIYDGPCRLLIRGRVDDFLNGASDINALSEAIDCGWEVRISTAIHFKLYVFDDTFIVGSSNLTGKGLALVPNENDELNIESSMTDSDLDLIESLWLQGQPVSSDTVKKMEDYLVTVSNQHSDTVPNDWPDTIMPDTTRDMYCADFPQLPFGDNHNNLNVSAYSDLIGLISYKWLLKTVSDNGGSASFGFLASRLHNDVTDDPAPYRKDVKGLISNLLSYVDALDAEELKVTRPRHTQVVILRSQ